MSKQRRSGGRAHGGGTIDSRQHGLRAFQNNRFDMAIALWTPLAPKDPAVARALAEAHFRRTLQHAGSPDAVGDLCKAVALAPSEPRFHYHLGMALHRSGDLAGAITAYHEVLRLAPSWPNAAMLLALATLEQNPAADLSRLPGSTPAMRQALAPAAALLRGQPIPPDSATPAGAVAESLHLLWRGLSKIAAGDSSAASDLSVATQLPNPYSAAIRRCYLGVAAAQNGDSELAIKLWQQVYTDRTWPAGLWLHIEPVLYQRLHAQYTAGDLAAAATTAYDSVGMPLSSVALNELRVRVLDDAAFTAASSGEWARAAALWEGARQIVSASADLGSPRPLLHNLALAYEAQNLWIEAAEAWRAMLRTRPRKSKTATGDQPAAPGEVSPSQWAWVRGRVIECYKKAGRPDEAVAVFRQAIKADPSDLDMRLQLADALLANEQEQAAFNEVQRILQIDPQHIDARVRFALLLSARGEMRPAEQILRALAAQNPQRQDLQRQLGAVLLDHGTRYEQAGQYAAAISVLTEGQPLMPDDYRFPLYLARVAIDQRKVNQARPHLERVQELAGDQPTAYLMIVECWLVADQIDDARAAITRAEQALTALPEFYVDVGLMIMRHNIPPPDLSPFGRKPRQAKPKDSPWTGLATELFGRATAMRPDDAQIRLSIASGLVSIRPDLATGYADDAARLAPDDPDPVLMQVLLNALNDKRREARALLRRGIQIAQRQNNQDALGRAEELGQLIDNPLLRSVFQMNVLMEQMGLDPEDMYL